MVCLEPYLLPAALSVRMCVCVCELNVLQAGSGLLLSEDPYGNSLPFLQLPSRITS